MHTGPELTLSMYMPASDGPSPEIVSVPVLPCCPFATCGSIHTNSTQAASSRRLPACCRTFMYWTRDSRVKVKRKGVRTIEKSRAQPCTEPAGASSRYSPAPCSFSCALIHSRDLVTIPAPAGLV